MFRFILASAITALIAGCAPFQTTQAISTQRIQDVVDDVKRQVSIYVTYQTLQYDSAGLVKNSMHHYCGNGLIDFDITEVKIDLLTTLDNSVGGGATLAAIPIGTPALVGGSVGASVQTVNTQQLVFTFSPLEDRQFRYVLAENEPRAPLAEVMVALRDALIREADVTNRICSRLKQDADNTYKIAFNVVTDVNGKLSVVLAPLTFGATGETKNTIANTVTFTFRPHNFLLKPSKPKSKSKKKQT